MAVGTTADATTIVRPEASKSYILPMVLMVALYFSIGFITALNDILIPHFKDLFHLTNFLALLVQFCFFGAYFVMSLPSGLIVGRIGYKPSMIAALCTVAAGLLLFVPASIAISYPLFLFALFIVGSGFALLQVAITIFGHGPLAIWAIVSCGLFNSVMWPCIFPLAVKGLGKFTSQGSGILITMVVGGAIVPVLQGFLADKLGYQHSFVMVLLCYAYLVFFSLSGYKIRQPRFDSLPNYVPPVEI